MEVPYEVVLMLKPTKKEREEGIGAKILVPTFLVPVETSGGEDSARMAAGMAAVMDEANAAKLVGVDRARVEVFTRPFAQA